jgi:hypothetical protein
MDANMPDINPQIPSPPEAVAPERHRAGAHAERSGHKFGRAIAALGLVTVGTLAGYEMGSHQADAPEISATQPEVPHLSARVKLDIAAAVEADTCDTKVTTKEVESIYAQLFSKESQPKTLSALQKSSGDVIKTLEKLTSTMQFADLTPDEQTFINKAFNQKLEGDTDEYINTFRDYLGRFGITLTDKWPKGTQIAKNLKETGVTNGVHQMTSGQLKNNYSTKAQIVLAMNSMSKMPVTVIRESGVNTVVLGDFKDDHYDGYAFYGKGTIAMNVSQPKGTNFSDALNMHMPTLIDHEISHLLDNQLCAGLLGEFVDDPGYKSLNRAFEYGKHKEKVLNEQRETANLYTTLGANTTDDSKAVVVKAYGANDVAEDKATLLGEVMLSTGSMSLLYVDANSDSIIIDEKVAMLLARLSEKDSKVGEYYTSMIALTHLTQIVSYAEQPLYEALQKSEPESAGINYANKQEAKKNKQFQTASKNLEPYQKLSKELDQHIYSQGRKIDKHQDQYFDMK